MTTGQAEGTKIVTVQDVPIEISELGKGKPLLFLHGGWPGGRIDPKAPVLAQLAKSSRVITPTHPGFGRASAPDWMSHIDDLAYLYLGLMEALNLRDTVVVGVGFGGWLAAEIAVKSTERMSQLVLANAVGIKISDRETRDIVDIYAILDSELAALAYADPKASAPDRSTLSDDDFLLMARSREATGRFGWNPYLYDPKLKRRLQRINVPTLVLWGEADGIVKPEYGRAYAAAIPGARFVSVPKAGHFPHVEQPDAFARQVLDFADGKTLEVAP